MKKIFSYAFIALSAIVALASCSKDLDSNPTPQTPTKFVLNNPTAQKQYIQLTEKTSILLSWSQPDYGFPVNATYSIQVGIVDGNQVKWNTMTTEDGKTVPVYLSTTYTTCKAEIPGAEIAEAICAVDAFPDKDSYVDMGYRKIAFRVLSSIRNATNHDVEGVSILSNEVYMDNLAAYNAVKSEDYMYIIGDCGGWTGPEAGNAEALKAWRIFEDKVGSKIYVGEFEIAAGKFQFRFYSALTGWDGGASVGSQADDSPIGITFTDGVYSGAVVAPGKGSWQDTSWAGGILKIKLDMNKKTVLFEKK